MKWVRRKIGCRGTLCGGYFHFAVICVTLMKDETGGVTMDFDAFEAGVEPGGLLSKSDIRLLICYLLRSIGKPLSKETVNEIMQEYGLANYFEVNQSLLELVGAGSIAETAVQDTSYYEITANGRRTAEMLESALPVTVREKAVNAALNLLAKAKREQENLVTVEKKDGKYFVTCRILDNDAELMSVRLFVADELQAQTVREKFLQKPADVYQCLISRLTEDAKE